MYLARIAKTEFQHDDQKIGWLKVIYKGEVRWAMPKMRFGAFEMPTKEWIEKFGDTLGVWIVSQSAYDDRNREAYLVWDGFAFFEGKVPQEALDGFPYVRMWFTENWKIIVDDTKDKNVFKVVHADGSVIVIDRTKDAEQLLLNDAKLGHKETWTKDGITITDKSGNELTFASDGVKINGDYVVLKPMLDWLLQNAPQFVMGNMGVPAPILPNVVTAGNQGLDTKKNFVSNR